MQCPRDEGLDSIEDLDGSLTSVCQTLDPRPKTRCQSCLYLLVPTQVFD